VATEFSMFWRVVAAISSIEAETSSALAACSVEPCERLCELSLM
jgi:hypothetical protein